MSIYVYRQRASAGARELAEALGGIRWKGVQVPMATRARAGDFVVSWGETLAPPTGVGVLNGAPIRNKFTDAQVLAQAGVPTIQVSRTRPTITAQPVAPTSVTDPARSIFEEAMEAATDFQEISFARGNPVFMTGVRDFHGILGRLSTALNTALPTPRPVAPVADVSWVGRDDDHIGGIDLINPTASPDYWVKKETFTQEFRIHSFLGRSIRAGKKAIRENFANPSTWVRSWDGGWRIVYDGVSANQAQRDLAHRAVAALGLQFGAVDIGQKADGTLMVLEVNRAPGLDGGTITSYRDAVRHWVAGEWTMTNQAATRPARRRRAA